MWLSSYQWVCKFLQGLQPSGMPPWDLIQTSLSCHPASFLLPNTILFPFSIKQVQKSLHCEKISLHQQASLLWALACPGEANRSQQLGKGGNKEKTHAQGECDTRLAGTNSSTRLPSTQIVCHVPPIPPSPGNPITTLCCKGAL